MSNLTTSILVFLAEAAVVLFILFAVYGFLTLRRRRQDRQITQNLVKDFRDELPDRRDELRSMLTDAFEMEDEKAEEKINFILNKEKLIYLHAIQAFSGKHRGMLRKINEDVGDLGGAYRNLVAYLNLQLSSQDAMQELNNKIKELERNNRNVQTKLDATTTELDSTNAELDRIMKEYTALYERFKDEEKL